MQDLSQKIKDLKDRLNEQKQTSLFQILLEKLSLIEQMIKNIQLNQEKQELKDIIADNKSLKQQNDQTKENITLSEKIERLRDVATKKTENNKIFYVLYRPTVDFEYENGLKDGYFVTTEDTEWIVDFEESQEKRNGNAPVISALIPEDSVKDVLNAFGQENSTWGDLGTNPNKDKYRILVKPGSYKIIQELKKTISIYKYINDLKKTYFENSDYKINALKSPKIWKVKIKGLNGWHSVKNIQDLGPDNGNNYELEDGRVFHQKLVENIEMGLEPKFQKILHKIKKTYKYLPSVKTHKENGLPNLLKKVKDTLQRKI